MKYTETELQKKTKKELIKIILKLTTYVLDYSSTIVIADGVQGMRRGE